MLESKPPTTAEDFASFAERAPRGAVILSAIAVAVVIGIWFAFYFMAFLPLDRLIRRVNPALPVTERPGISYGRVRRAAYVRAMFLSVTSCLSDGYMDRTVRALCVRWSPY